jgi:multiple sugar transport system permease protein
MLITALIPIVWGIVAGFYQCPLFGKTWNWVALNNFAGILRDPAFWKATWLSVYFGLGSTILQVVAGIACALLVKRQIAGINLIRSIMLLPYLIPTVAIALTFRWMAHGTYGVINDILIKIGIIDKGIPFFGDLTAVMPAMILTNSWKYTPFIILLVLARLLAIPEAYYESAKVFGASSFRRFWDITFPNIRGVVAIAFLLRGIWMFNKFDVIWLLTKGGPGTTTTTLPVLAYKMGFQYWQLGKAAAIGTLLFMLLAIIAIIYFGLIKPEEEVSA